VEQPAAVSPGWRKSSYSGNGGAQCVEAGSVPGQVLIRDTKDNSQGLVLRVSAETWRAFTEIIRATPRR
jgi:hypothetical protein